MKGLIDASRRFRSRSILPITVHAGEFRKFNNRYPPDTEPLHAAGPTDDPDEPSQRKIDVNEGVDDTEDATVAIDADRQQTLRW